MSGFSFGNWMILLWLFVPASMVMWIWLRDRLPVLGWGSDRRVALPQDYSVTRHGWFADFVLKCFGSTAPLLLAVAIILLAGPRHLGVPRSQRELTNIEFCLDLSGSMTSKFGNGSRYDAAIAAINGFVEKRKGDAFGLTVFGTETQHWIPLTSDASAFRCATPFLNPAKGLPPGYGGGTMIGKGLRKCRDALLDRDEGDRMIVLVSDGASADLGSGQEEELGRLLRDDQIVVYSIHIGEGISPPEVSTITNITGGVSFNPTDVQALNHVFSRIDQMQVAKVDRTYVEVLDWFQPFVICGMGLLSLLVVSMLGLRYTPW
ncbi:MAG: VWA domain-containing protein [Pirellulaceae bacterium]